MSAPAILSAPMPMAGAASPPPADAGTTLPAAAAAFGALIDARTVPTTEAMPATARIDPPVPLPGTAGTMLPADLLPTPVADAAAMPAPAIDVTGEAPISSPVIGIEGLPEAPLPDDAPLPAAQPQADAVATPSEPVPPPAGIIARAVQPQPAVVAQPESTPSSEEEPDAVASGAVDGGETVPQPVSAMPQAPLPLASPVPQAAQPAATAAAEPDAETVPQIKRVKTARQTHSAANLPASGAKEAATGDVARPAAPGVAATAVAEVAATADQPDAGLPSPLLTQTMAPVANRPAAAVYPQAAQAAPQSPVVAAQPGRMGADIGVEIARAAKGEREDLLIRLDPRDMGRINVRLSFDGDGVLRAVMSADSPGALEMLRRESGDLNRALADAGIRSDAQSLRFDARSGDQGQGGSQSGQRGQQAQSGGSQSAAGDGAADLAEPHYRPLRSSGQVDMMA